jgi:predicted permease
MRWHYRVMLRLRTLFRRAGVESELSEEVRLHIERMVEENVARGMSAAEARRAAVVEFGGVEQVKEECRDARGVRWLEEAWQDLRYGMRQLRREPGFTFVALITLALGIGATTAIFSVADVVLLRRPPYRDAGRIVVVLERFPRFPGALFVVSPDFRAWKERSRSFEAIGAYGFGSGANLTEMGEPVHVSVGNVTPEFFGVFGIQPVVGRGFVEAEARQGAARVALLSETLWRSRFGADPRVVGKTIRLDGEVYQVAGVAPGSVAMATADVWTPLELDAPIFSPHNPSWTMLQVWGRLKRGTTAAEAKADLQVLTEQLNREYGVQSAKFRAGVRVDVTPLHEFLVFGYGRLLEILLAAVGCLLLIACANVANLLLARGVAREGEMAVRAALGAGRWRLIRQSLAESLLLAVGGGAAGCAAGVWSTRFLKQLVPDWLPVHVGLDGGVLAASAGIAVASLLVFGVGPAIVGARAEAGEALRHAGSHATVGGREAPLPELAAGD